MFQGIRNCYNLKYFHSLSLGFLVAMIFLSLQKHQQSFDINSENAVDTAHVQQVEGISEVSENINSPHLKVDYSSDSGKHTEDSRGAGSIVVHQCSARSFPLGKEKPHRLDPPNYTPILLKKEHFYRYSLQYIDAHCDEIIRVGKVTDGGWDVCTSGPYQLLPNECIVLSFGINNDFSFDDHIANRLNCTVHAFDPSMNVSTHRRSERVWFYDFGLGETNNKTEKGWQLYTLKTAVEKLQLKSKYRDIDVLKFDIEGSELGALRTMIHDKSLENVKQIMFELHSYPVIRDHVKIPSYTSVLWDLEKIGFKRFLAHQNLRCMKIPSDPKLPSRAHCIELYYINERYLPDACKT